MFSKRLIHIVFLFVILLTVSSCSRYQRLLKSTDINAKYEAAFKYYDQGDYFRAIQIFDELVTYFRATDKAEKIYYAYAYANYNEGDYVLAEYHFKNFVTTFPSSPKAEECAYMAAYCDYMDSPEYYLDQTSTKDAINSLQLFVNEYPKSKYVEDCNKYIDELRLKLEEKSFSIGMLYFRTEEYKAAITAFNSTLKDYPDTKYKEEALFYIMKSYFIFANNSIAAKKSERYQAAVKAYTVFISNFPQSKFIREADAINRTASKELTKLKTNT
jgi:outer membrane protein assembly factor BamD